MAPFGPIPYTYVPTPLRSKSTTVRHKIPPKPLSILDKNQHIKPRSVALEAAPAAANGIRDGQSKIRTETGTIYSNNDKENDNDDDDEDDDLLTVDKIYTKRSEEGFAIEDPSPDHTARRVDKIALEETGCSVNHSTSTVDDNLGTSQSNPIVPNLCTNTAVAIARISSRYRLRRRDRRPIASRIEKIEYGD